MLAALLGWPQGTFASKVEVSGSEVDVTREVDGGLETVKLQPAGGGHHRSSPQRAALCVAAEHHEGQVEAARDQDARRLGVDIARRLETLKVAEPPKRQAGDQGRHRSTSWSAS